jgi:hypothetical protein
MGDVIHVGWFVDNDGETYLGRITKTTPKIEREKATPQAGKAIEELLKRLDRAKRQA